MIKTIKTKQFKITALVLALVLTVSCVMWNTTKVHAQELEINNTSVQTFAGSRAITNGKLVGAADASVDMGVFVTGGSADKYNASNMHWHHNGDHWDCTRPALFEGANSSQKIYACAPYVDGATDGVITVTASEQTDWLVATSRELTSNDVDLTMTHALAKLVITPGFGSEVENMSIAKVEVGGMYASGDLSIADNTWSNLGTANATFEVKNNELLVIPMDSCTSFPITFTMEDGRTFTTTVDIATVDNKLEAGVQYNIKLQVGQDVVTIGGITAESWVPSTGGVLETE